MLRGSDAGQLILFYLQEQYLCELNPPLVLLRGIQCLIMASSFSFGFSSDDIERDDEDGQGMHVKSTPSPPSQGLHQVEPRSHLLADLVGKNDCAHSLRWSSRPSDVSHQIAALPSKIAFSNLVVESPTGQVLALPRRELFDIKMQLMAEDNPEMKDGASGLDDSDIKTNVYEGGLKTWECSLDLAKLLIDRGLRQGLNDLHRVNHVVEVSL